ELRALAAAEGDRIAAILVEPILGSAGVVVPPQRFFDVLAELREAHGLLLIADEVATGFGRTGRMFACDWFGLEPDVMTLSKGIDGGYVPLGATAFSDE